MTTLTLNGKTSTLRSQDPTRPLLYALREEGGLCAAKFGCGLAQCGACTVLINGSPARACVTPVASLAGARVQTLEGLQRGGRMHPLQSAFVAEQAAQCGYCTSGMIMAAKALLDRNPRPSDDDIKQALDAQLCRCGTHPRVVRAVRAAVLQMARG